MTLDNHTSYELTPEQIASIEDYKIFVKKSADDLNDVLVANGENIHSQITSANIFRTTKNKLEIYTTGFRDDINEGIDKYEFFKYLQFALKNLPEIKVLVDRNCDTNVIKLIEAEQKLRPDNIIIHQTTKEVRDEINSKFINFKKIHNLTTNDFHFQIGDNSKLRLEYDSENKKALVNFNNPEFAQILSNIFNKAFNKSHIYKSS
jgi:hypothetical protein